VNHAYIHLSVPTVRVITKQIQISVFSGGIDLIGNSIRRNTSRSMKTGSNQFALWGIRTFVNNSGQFKGFFPEHSKELTHCQYYP